ncbi:aminotransferase class V-fold PLP-dependent enzyme [Leptolyngbya sp. PCC 6406]|uniref:aminotransferase class V-fold PLP-dependent enzyme n=1 Tax=Leptolyngbya sp. PCC 6406 TaxID=1173264 RepID=UPI0002ACA27E|nr:aminotransferase class V-fold PLP-dependent enzyme [Leptolyngbya sp. PCC 6406]
MAFVAPPTVRLDLDYVRQQFPALAGDWTFFDNAGGSQVARPVGDRITDFLYGSNVQLGASYGVSQTATERVAAAHQGLATLINAPDPQTVVLGSSTSALFRILAHCLGQTLQPGDEVVVTNCDHEANISPWVDWQGLGITVKVWTLNPETLTLDLADLADLLTPRTRLVAVTHVSNVLGTINPIRAIADLAHHNGSLICVDGVAYAPHRRVDVQALDVDFYAFSLYKTYGPHQALLYGRRELLEALPGFNHYFITSVPYKFQPGNVNFELAYGSLGILDYLTALAAHHGGGLDGAVPEPPASDLTTSDLTTSDLTTQDPGTQLRQAFALIRDHETALGDRLLTYLRQHPAVAIIGCPDAHPDHRVPTISFVVAGRTSAAIPPRIDPHHIGIRYGDFYAVRLIEDLGLALQDGVVRVSMVHYNTLEECDRLIACLDAVLA